MATSAGWQTADAEVGAPSWQAAREKVERAEGEVVVDCSAVSRIDYKALRALEDLADVADIKGVKVALRGVSIEMYKVLKLVKLGSRFSFLP